MMATAISSISLFFAGNCPLDPPKSMPRLAEEEEQMLGGSAPPTGPRRTLPPVLPTAPNNLTPEQQKRRHIVASLVHSENNYVATLQRLVNVSKKLRNMKRFSLNVLFFSSSSSLGLQEALGREQPAHPLELEGVNAVPPSP